MARRLDLFRRGVWLAGVLGLLAIGGGGCTSLSGDGGDEAIEGLHLFGAPVALSMDRRKGPDGFGVRVFASVAGRAKGVPLRRGTLEVLMFDGSLGDADPSTAKPARVWTFPSATLAANAATSSLGVGYQFALHWEGAQPTQNHVTVIARFRPPSGPPLYSAPSVIPLVIK